MPLYMDFHKFSNITIEQVIQAHIEDRAVQDKFEVKYHQFWVNEKAGSVFCLMEGPDKESCEAVHRSAHGNLACEITEVEREFFELFMNHDQRVDHGLVKDENGTPDIGYRFVLLVDIMGKTSLGSSKHYKSFLMPDKPKRITTQKIHQWNGRIFKHLGIESIISVFKDAEDALNCALSIRKELDLNKNYNSESEWGIFFKIVLSGGQPVTEKKAFFEETIILARRLNLIADNYELIVNSLVKNVSDWDDITKNHPEVRVINKNEEKFISSVFDISEANLDNSRFGVEKLSHEIGMSKPQLYRKMMALTGKSPNSFIRDFRMNEALGMIKNDQYNIAQIAYEVGYNNPSYFSKCFHQKYGVLPSKMIE